MTFWKTRVKHFVGHSYKVLGKDWRSAPWLWSLQFTNTLYLIWTSKLRKSWFLLLPHFIFMCLSLSGTKFKDVRKTFESCVSLIKVCITYQKYTLNLAVLNIPCYSYEGMSLKEKWECWIKNLLNTKRVTFWNRQKRKEDI